MVIEQINPVVSEYARSVRGTRLNRELAVTSMVRWYMILGLLRNARGCPPAVPCFPSVSVSICMVWCMSEI